MSREAAPHYLQLAYEGQMLAKMSYSLPEIVPEEVSNTANVSAVFVAIVETS
jgi:hypothetical protein